MLLIIPLVSIEIISFSFLSLTNKSTHLPSGYLAKYERFKDKEDCSWGDLVSHHPFLMLRYKRSGKCINELSNQRGLVGPDFGDEKDTSFYNFLILGGSVAELLFLTGKLEMQLNQAYISPSGKPFKIWNAAMSAGQQPRQAIANMMYGEIADSIISLEGFNEHFNLKAQFEIDTPSSSWYELERVILNNTQSSSPQSTVRTFLAPITRKIRKGSILSHTFFGVLLNQIYENISLKENRELTAKLSYEQSGNKDELKKAYIVKYKSYVRAMGAVAQNRGQKLFFFLQPVPAIGKKLTEKEKEVVGDLSYRERYLEIETSLSQLNSDEIYFKSLLDIFEDYEGQLYGDIIHFTGESNGNDILSKKMAAYIAEKLKLKKRI